MAFTEYFLGKREQISWKEEGTFGTGVTPDLIVGYNVTVTPNFSKGFQEILSAGADARTINSLTLGPEDLRFTLEFVPSDWVFLKYVFGTVADLGSDPYTHTFTLNDSVQSFTLQWAKRGSTNHVLTLSGCVALKSTVSWAKTSSPGKEGHIKVSMDCVAQNVTQGTTITSISSPTATPFQFRMVKLTLDGNEITEVNSGELSFDTGIDPSDSRYCNSTLNTAIGEPIPKTFMITGRVNINVKDKTYWDLWDAGTAVGGACKLEFVRGANDDMDFTFSNFFVSDGIAPTTIEDVTNVDLAFQALTTTAVSTDSTATY